MNTNLSNSALKALKTMANEIVNKLRIISKEMIAHLYIFELVDYNGDVIYSDYTIYPMLRFEDNCIGFEFGTITAEDLLTYSTIKQFFELYNLMAVHYYIKDDYKNGHISKRVKL